MLMSLSAMATIVDGVRQKPTYTTSGFVENEEVYLYNVEAGKFWVNGNTYGTQASLGETGLLVRFVPTGSGDYYLQDYYNNGWWYAFFASETQMYVDRHSDANYYWQVENNGSTFRLYVSSRNPVYYPYSGSGLYVGLEVSSNTSNTALSPLLLEDTGHYIEWAFVTKSDFEVISEKIKVYEKAQELKSMIDKIEALHADASSAKAVYLDESSTMAELQAAIDAALPVYVQAIIDNAPDKNNVDVTEMLVNPEYENGTNGWTVNSASGGNVAVAGLPTNKCFEAYNNSNFDIYQELSELPVGVYEIEVQGFYRYLRDDAAWQAYKAQNVEYVKPSGVPVYVYMNNNATPFKNIYSEPVTKGTLYTTDATLLYPAALNPCEDDLGNWYPNEMYNSAIAFNAGMYKQSAFGLVAKDGDKIRIGVKGASNQGNDSWVIWDNFKLIYRGFQADVIKPVLEAEMTTCQSTYMGLLMGKSQYAAMTQALADAQTAIDNNDGEAMFNALNALYDAKDPALSSKDLFLAQEVPAALQDLTDAINATSGQKLSNAVVEAANTLKANIEGNLVYEDADVEQLKQDVNNAISNISNSIAVYAQIPTAVTNLNTAATQKAAQTWIDDAATTASEATAAYNDGTYTDAEAVAKIDEINTLIESINNSADLYAQFNDAIGRLEAAIQLVTDDGQHVSKNMMAIANVQLTNAKNVYAEGSIADGDIPARITSIDDTIIPNLTQSVVLYQQLSDAIASLKSAIEEDREVSAKTLNEATETYNSVSEAYENGTINDNEVEAQITAINNAIDNLNTSASIYSDFATSIATLEDAITEVSGRVSATMLSAANTLLSTAKTQHTEGTVNDDAVEARNSELGVACSNLGSSAPIYDVLASTRSEVEDLTVQVQDAYTALENLRTEIDDRYLTNEYRIDAGTYLDDQSGERNGYESDVNDLKTDIEPLGSALDATAATITDDHSGDYSSIESTITQLSINANGLKNNISNLVNNAEATVEDYIYASQFIIEMSGDYATFCSEADLDFTDVVGVKAFVAEFNETTMEVQLNRVLNVPAGTGIVLIGDAGTYTIPEGNNVATFTNELVGVSRRTVLAKTEGAYTNYIFANGSTGAGFYAVQDGTTLAAGKAYIPLRTTALSGAGVKSKGIGFVINDDTATGIDMAGAAHATTDDAYYTVTGTRVLTPTPGSIYIKNGKKVLVK